MSDPQPPSRLSKTVFWVTLAHLFVLLGIGFWPTRKIIPPSPMTMIEMVDAVSLTPSSKGPIPTPQLSTGPLLGKPEDPTLSTPPPTKSPPPAPAPPTPEKTIPTPIPTVDPEPPQKEPESISPPTPNEFAPKTPTKEIKTPSKPIQKTTPSHRPPVKVNLRVITRNDEASNDSPSLKKTTAKRPTKNRNSDASDQDQEDENSSSDQIAQRLGSALGKSGTGGAVQIGPLSTPGGGPGNFGSYFGLIRKQMYDAWNRPVHLAQKDLSALVKITIENDGRISNVAMVAGSGIRDFDESILEAARRVGKIREPLPEGLPHEITIRFKFDD